MNNMNEFPCFCKTELYKTIRMQIEVNLEIWNEDDDYTDDNELLDEYLRYFQDEEDSHHVYDISNEDLNNTYRQGSNWILDKLEKVYKDWDDAFIVEMIGMMNMDNDFYLRQLIYWILRTLQDDLISNHNT